MARDTNMSLAAWEATCSWHAAETPGEFVPAAELPRGPGEWAPDVLLVSPRGRPAPGDYGAWLDAGPGVACKSLALPLTLTYIVIHGSSS